MSFEKSYLSQGESEEVLGGTSGFYSVNADTTNSAFSNSFPRQVLSDMLTSNLNTTNNNISSQRSGRNNVQDYFASDVAANATSTGASSSAFLSQIEAAILRSTIPIELNDSEEITVNGQRGIWANKSEVLNWRGIIPIEQYTINQDQHPEIITKRSTQSIEYLQELAVRYLRPPTPPAPGEIVITQEANTMTPPAPPLVIRQQPARPATPEPLVFREIPPQAPVQVGRKVITISGKRLPPPPRKVVIERLAALPSKPQGVMIERWLPYTEVKRRVIFQKSNVPDPVIVKPRNVIIQWEAPQVSIKKEVKYLGVIRANPAEYVQRYRSTLKAARDMPQFVLDIKPPQGIILAADYKYNQVHELEGAISALNLIDLDKEGLGEYRSQLSQARSSGGAGGHSIANNSNAYNYSLSSEADYSRDAFALENSGNSRNANYQLINEIFSQVDSDGSASISTEEAESLLLKLNSQLGRSYSEREANNFMNAIDTNRDGQISLQEFRRAFERLL